MNYDISSLSLNQLYDYDTIVFASLLSKANAYFSKYEPLFNQKSDFIFSNIVQPLDDFALYDTESIYDYLVLLQDVPNYIENAISYTQKQADEQIYITSNGYNHSLEYIENFISSDINVLDSSFSKRIQAVDFISEAEKEVYIKKSQDIIYNTIIPSFDKLYDFLSNMQLNKFINTKSLKEINQYYAEFDIIKYSSTIKNPKELFDITEEYYIDCIKNAITLMNNDQVSFEIVDLMGNQDKIVKDNVIDFLETNYTNYFPSLEILNYELSYLDESAGSDSILAYYVTPPIDNINRNIMRLNSNTISNDALTSYTTIAHEGIPGHMYHFNYLDTLNLHPIRDLISFNGYVEGFAVTAQDLAIDYLDYSDETKQYIKSAYTSSYPLYSLLDLGINYFGWSRNELKTKLSKYYIFSDVDEIYDMMIDLHGVYQSYGLGFIQFKQSKDLAKEKLQDQYNEIEFNTLILEKGIITFDMLEVEVNNYLN